MWFLVCEKQKVDVKLKVFGMKRKWRLFTKEKNSKAKVIRHYVVPYGGDAVVHIG